MFEHINKFYGVNAEIGRRVTVDDKPGVIVSDEGKYIGVVFDGDKATKISYCHPTWKVVYLEMGKVPKMTRSQKRYKEYLKADWFDGTFADWLGIKKKDKYGKV